MLTERYLKLMTFEKGNINRRNNRHDGRERRDHDVRWAIYHAVRCQPIMVKLLARLMSVEEFKAELENESFGSMPPLGEDEVDVVLAADKLSEVEETFCSTIWQFMSVLPEDNQLPASKDPPKKRQAPGEQNKTQKPSKLRCGAAQKNLPFRATQS